MQFLQQELAKVNVKVTVTPLEAGVEADRVWGAETPEKSDVQLLYSGWSASTGDADYGLRPLFASESFPPNLYNTSYYKNEKVDQALAEGIKTADDTKRSEAYKIVQQTVFEDAPWIFMGEKQNISVKTKKLSGVYMLPDGGFSVDGAKFTGE